MQYDQRNQMNATRALFDLAYGSYRCFKKCNATYDTPCMSLFMYYNVLYVRMKFTFFKNIDLQEV
jgi:hypothetical protein